MKAVLYAFALLGLTSLLSPTQAQSKPVPKQGLTSYADSFFRMQRPSSNREAFEFIGQTLRDNGASIRMGSKEPKDLNLEIKSFKETVNSYDLATAAIRVAAMPSASQTNAYWANWSRLLTNGRWNYRKFFQSPQEMHTLARFNVLVLTAHEYGHYLDYRYNVSGYKSTGFGITSGKPLNCTEYLADKFAVAFINHLSNDKRFSNLRGRYLALINEINRNIPAKNQMPVKSFAQLETNCGSIKLEQNGVAIDDTVNTNFFRSYVSAYFGRHRVLLNHKAFPSLKALIQQTLTSRLPKASDYTKHTISIRKIGEFPWPEGASTAFDPQGNVWQFEVKESKVENKLHALSVITRDSKGVKQVQFRYELPAELRQSLDVYWPLILNTNEFVIPILPDMWDFSEPAKAENVVYFLSASRSAGGSWNQMLHTVADIPQPVEGTTSYSWDVTPAGKLLLFQDIEEKNGTSLYRYEVDRTRFTLSAPTLVHQGSLDHLFYLANDNNEYFAMAQGTGNYHSGRSLVKLYPKGLKNVMGNGLHGLALSANRALIELDGSGVYRFISNSTFRMITRSSSTNKNQNMYSVYEVTLTPS
jgi:hypothetical protein